MGGGIGKPGWIGPLLHERVRQLIGARGWPRSLAVRRVLALTLVLLAVVLAMRPGGERTPPTERIVVAARDLSPGIELRGADLRLRELPVDALPAGVRRDRTAVAGRVLVSAARSGEPITDARLLGRVNTALTASAAGMVSVGVRLADPGVAALLRPGARVDVVVGAATPLAGGTGSTGGTGGEELVAAEATVITVRDAESDDGTPAPIVVLALARESATRVASLSLRQPVTVTLR